MERDIYLSLALWKEKKDRKPLIIDGARQVGKTWIIKEFGNREYRNMAYINCDKYVNINLEMVRNRRILILKRCK